MLGLNEAMNRLRVLWLALTQWERFNRIIESSIDEAFSQGFRLGLNEGRMREILGLDDSSWVTLEQEYEAMRLKAE